MGAARCASVDGSETAFGGRARFAATGAGRVDQARQQNAGRLVAGARSQTRTRHARRVAQRPRVVPESPFPNLRIAYLGSRTYGGYGGALNPEPYAYEGAFAVRWLIQRQIKGDVELNESNSPLLLWGPYLWAEGAKGRKLDKLVWERNDFGGDGIHPNDSGRLKVANLLLDFLTIDPLAKPWFAKP
jgi:hypothetical protein